MTRSRRGPKFKGESKICQQATLARFHQSVKNGPHGIIQTTMKELQPVYPWLTRSMYNGYVKALKKKNQSSTSTTVSSSSANSNNSTVTTFTVTTSTVTTSTVTTSSSSSSTTNSNDEACVPYKKAGRPKGSTVEAKIEKEKKIEEFRDAITVKYKQCQDEVKDDPNRERVTRGIFNRITEEQKEYGLLDIKVSLPTLKELVKKRIKRGGLENVHRGNKSAMADVEPVLAYLITTSNEARNPIGGIDGIITLAESLITDTMYEQKIIEYQDKFCPESKNKNLLDGRPTSANLTAGWARGFLKR
jgi:hypothetical protein